MRSITDNAIGGNYPVSGDTVEYADPNNPYSRHPWPAAGENLVPTSYSSDNKFIRWFAKSGQYLFFVYDIDGNTIISGLTHYISEGNDQFVGGEAPPIDPEPSADFEFIDSKVCKDVDSSYNCINQTNRFYKHEGTVYAWLELNNIYIPLAITFRWYDPLGQEVAAHTENTTDPHDAFHEYWYWCKVYGNITISEFTRAGSWHVDIYIDGELYAREYFDILKEPSPIILNISVQ